MEDNKKKVTQEYYDSVITKKIAKRIIELVDKEDYTWRSISQKISEEYPGIVLNPGNQLDGMYMEYSARELTNP